MDRSRQEQLAYSLELRITNLKNDVITREWGDGYLEGMRYAVMALGTSGFLDRDLAVYLSEAAEKEQGRLRRSRRKNLLR